MLLRFKPDTNRTGDARGLDPRVTLRPVQVANGPRIKSVGSAGGRTSSAICLIESVGLIAFHQGEVIGCGVHLQGKLLAVEFGQPCCP